ncbi:MAG: hypothetical protein Q9169_007755, partial [Polycauliona sp. 2 TL-2023]
LLKPVCRRFVTCFDAPESAEVKNFWSHIVSDVSHESGLKLYKGWITAFCFWDLHGENLHEKVFEDADETLELDGVRYHHVHSTDVPPGFASVPVKLVDGGLDGKIFETSLVAGSVGLEVTASGDNGRGMIVWIMERTSGIHIARHGDALPGLDKKCLSHLRRKQAKLSDTQEQMLASLSPGSHGQQALKATFIFADYQAGTAVCIHPDGWILTCAHCIGESEEEWRENKKTWLLSYTGVAIQTECCAWDPTLDLALLKIISIEASSDGKALTTAFPHVRIARNLPKCLDPIICIGQPGRDDLESTTKRKTTYNLVKVSEGRFCGMVPGVDPCDNSEIGSLKHDAWTYWGHSGAPLVSANDGMLIGLHSSWDEKTLMRHGVPLQAIRRLLCEALSQLDGLHAESKRALALLCVSEEEPRQRRSTRKAAALGTKSRAIVIDDSDRQTSDSGKIRAMKSVATFKNAAATMDIALKFMQLAVMQVSQAALMGLRRKMTRKPWTTVQTPISTAAVQKTYRGEAKEDSYRSKTDANSLGDHDLVDPVIINVFQLLLDLFLDRGSSSDSNISGVWYYLILEMMMLFVLAITMTWLLSKRISSWLTEHCIKGFSNYGSKVLPGKGRDRNSAPDPALDSQELHQPQATDHQKIQFLRGQANLRLANLETHERVPWPRGNLTLSLDDQVHPSPGAPLHLIFPVMASDPSLRKRLLRDIAEIQSEPYPCIKFHVHESLEQACLVLSPEGSKSLHLRMFFRDYPLRAPHVTIQSRVAHPNVYGNYICASILNTEEGYTPAYTLKSIAIQLLSFFISDSIEQEYGGNVRLTTYNQGLYASPHNYRASSDRRNNAFHCGACGFDARPVTRNADGAVRTSREAEESEPRRASVREHPRSPLEQQNTVRRGHRFIAADETRRSNPVTASSNVSGTDLPMDSPNSPISDMFAEPSETAVEQTHPLSLKTPASDYAVEIASASHADAPQEAMEVSDNEPPEPTAQPLESLDTSLCNSLVSQAMIALMDLPREILLNIFSNLPFRELATISSASSEAREIIDFHDLIRVRELQCFCLKEHFQDTKLGVGVDVGYYGKEKKLSSEFDLLSDQAFYQHDIRTSIHGLVFQRWLPLPISRRHFATVRARTLLSLDSLASAGEFADPSHFSVLSHFLNDIVVSFSEEAQRADPRSTLAHASEKAVESYFAIYHLLLCLAADNPGMIRKANSKVIHFMSGKTSKTTCPNLGHLLVATLISAHHLSESLSVAIIKEAILRNVVWMLDVKGAGMAELSYLEPSMVSEYRLKKTFEASLTSYRLLMFCHLFCRNARGFTANTNDRTLAQRRDELFDTHGAPPRGVAASMAEEIRRIKSISSFPPFLKEMGIQDNNMPGKSEFTWFLRRMVMRSVEVGYSIWPISQAEALRLRIEREPGVEIRKGLVVDRGRGMRAGTRGWISFFPGGQRERDARGRGRGRGSGRRGRRG